MRTNNHMRFTYELHSVYLTNKWYQILISTKIKTTLHYHTSYMSSEQNPIFWTHGTAHAGLVAHIIVYISIGSKPIFCHCKVETYHNIKQCQDAVIT